MLKTNGENLPEVSEVFKEIIEPPERMFEMLRINVKHTSEMAVTELIKVELTQFCEKKIQEINGRRRSRKELSQWELPQEIHS